MNDEIVWCHVGHIVLAYKMADVNHVHVDSSKNPYHYSFSLCAGNNQEPRSNYNSNGPGPSNNKTYYTYHPTFDLKPSFNCDLCDRAFRTEVQYQRHVDDHVTCGTDGCQFTAHPKVVAAHSRSQHETGLYHLIKKLNTPEEVTKWIEERKRKYPTKKNIDEQKLVEQDRIERGEVIKRDNGRFNKKFGNRQRREEKNILNSREAQKKPQKKSVKNQQPKKPVLIPKPIQLGKTDEPKPDHCVIPAFPGLGGIEEKKPIETPTTQHVTKKQQSFKKEDKSQLVNKSLALLMTAYDDSEAETDDDEARPVSAPNKPESDNSESDSAPEEVKTVKSSIDIQDPPEEKKLTKKRKFSKSNRKGPKRRKFSSNQSSAIRARKQTLLEKLLQSEITHERKVILCCVRYIVENNFFETRNDKRQKNTKTDSLLPKKSCLLEGLLRDEIIRERNIILQSFRHIVNNNFFQPKE